MQWMEKVCLEIATGSERPEKPQTPKYPRNLLRHVTLSHVNGVKLQPKHMPNADESESGSRFGLSVLSIQVQTPTYNGSFSPLCFTQHA